MLYPAESLSAPTTTNLKSVYVAGIEVKSNVDAALLSVVVAIATSVDTSGIG
jgi:hypothetical protein